MKGKLIALLSVLVLIPISTSDAAPKIKSLATFKLIPIDQDVAGIAIGESGLYLFGNTLTGAYLSALNKDGTQRWLSPIIDTAIVTAGALDSTGNIWLTGSTSTNSNQVGTPTAIPSPSALNPDGISIGEESQIRPNLNSLALWKFNTVGALEGEYQLNLPAPVLPTSLSINKSGISIVGWQQSGSIFVSSDLLGNFSKPLTVGKTTTKLDVVVRDSEDSSVLLGSSAELFLESKAIGTRDGLILKINSKNIIVNSVRSGEKGAERNWSSSTSSLLLGGFLKSKDSNLATITKFSNTLKPTWTTRFKATSGALVTNANLGGFYAAYENRGKGILLALDKTGKVQATYSFSGKPISLHFHKNSGLYLFTGDQIYILGS